MFMRFAVLLVGSLVIAASEVEVHIRPTSVVQAPRATLADIADIRAEPDICERLGAIAICELPTLAPTGVDARLLTALLTRAAAPATLMISGSGTVSRAVRVFTNDELVAAAAAAVPGATTTLVRVGASLAVPASPDLVLAAEPLDAAAIGEVAFRVRAIEAGKETGRTLVVLQVARVVDIVVAARDLARGEVIGSGDVHVERRSATRANLSAAIAAELIVGSVARRNLRSGEPLSVQLVTTAPAVKAGRTVTALWPGRGFSIEVEATALADGKAGERIGLRRVYDGAVFSGVAQSDGSVVVTP